MLLTVTQCYSVFLSVTGIYWLLLIITDCYSVLLSAPHKVLLRITENYWQLLSVTECYSVLISFAQLFYIDDFKGIPSLDLCLSYLGLYGCVEDVHKWTKMWSALARSYSPCTLDLSPCMVSFWPQWESKLSRQFDFLYCALCVLIAWMMHILNFFLSRPKSDARMQWMQPQWITPWVLTHYAIHISVSDAALFMSCWMTFSLRLFGVFAFLFAKVNSPLV